MPKLRDLIYFDFERAASIYSQIEGGLLKETQSGEVQEQDERNIRKYDLKIFKPEFGGATVEKSSQITTRLLHHDLLGKLDEYLFEQGFGTDLSELPSSCSLETVHSRVRSAAYVRAEGWSILEDFDRLKKISGQHNRLLEFIGRCSMGQLAENHEFKAASRELDAARKRIDEIKDRNKRSKEEKRLRALEEKVGELIADSTGLSGNPEWLMEGIGFFIDLFMPSRILLSTYPFEHLPEFQVLANLKRECFVDGDLDSVLHAYGNRPNVKLTILGLMSSCPGPSEDLYDPVQQLEEAESATSDLQGFELGFRRVFRSFDEYYKFISYSRYPNVTLQPIAVYRDISPGQ